MVGHQCSVEGLEEASAHLLVADHGEELLELVDDQEQALIGGGGQDLCHRPPQVAVALEVLGEARGWLRRHLPQGRGEFLEGPGAGEHDGDPPALRARQGPTPKGGQKARPHHARLAAPGRTDHGEQASRPGHLPQAVHQVVGQCVAPEEVGAVVLPEGTQALVGVAGRGRGGDGIRRPRADGIEWDRLGQALELGRTAGLEGDVDGGPGEGAHRLADEDLSRLGLAAHPGRDVDRRTNEPFRGLHGLPCVDPHAHPDRSLGVGRGGLVGSLHDLDAAAHRFAHRGEDEVEAVALGADLGPLVGGHGGAHEGAVGRQQLSRLAVAVGLHVLGVAAQVGEEEASCAGRGSGGHRWGFLTAPTLAHIDPLLLPDASAGRVRQWLSAVPAAKIVGRALQPSRLRRQYAPARRQ